MMVKQIVFNLLTNAIKFTKRGGIVRLVTELRLQPQRVRRGAGHRTGMNAPMR